MARTMKVAIVDDEQDMRQSISQWLALSGFVLGLAGVASSSGLSALLCLLVMVLSVVWRLLA